MQTGANSQSTAAGLTIGAGVLAIVSAVLNWSEFAPADEAATTFKGTDLTAGTATLGIGIALVVIGIILFRRGPQTGGKGLSIAAIVLAAFVLFAGGYSAVAPGDALAEFESSSVAEAYGISDELAKEAIKIGLEQEQIEVSALIGAWVAAAAGVIGLLGGIMGVARAKAIRNAAQPPVAMTPPAGTPPASPPPTA